jgi:hypothetical protein
LLIHAAPLRLVCCCFPGPEAEGDDSQPPATPDNVQKVRHCCGLHVTVNGFAAHTSRNHCWWPRAGHAQGRVWPRILTVTIAGSHGRVWPRTLTVTTKLALAGNGFAAHTNRILVAARRTRAEKGLALRDGFSFFDPFFALFDQICSKTGFFGHICSVLIKFVQTGFC